MNSKENGQLIDGYVRSFCFDSITMHTPMDEHEWFAFHVGYFRYILWSVFMGKMSKLIKMRNQHFFNKAWVGYCISNLRMRLICSLTLLHFWGCITEHLTIIVILVVARIDYFCHMWISLCYFLLICFSCRFMHRSPTSSRTTTKRPHS